MFIVGHAPNVVDFICNTCNDYLKQIHGYMNNSAKMDITLCAAVIDTWQDFLLTWPGLEQVMMRSIKSKGGLTRGRGFAETIRLMWILSMHKCGETFDSIPSFTGLAHITSEQHVEMGVSRIQRDNTDLQKLIAWLSLHDPFCQNDSNLRSLSTGLTSTESDNVNCDNSEIGAIIKNRYQLYVIR